MRNRHTPERCLWRPSTWHFDRAQALVLQPDLLFVSASRGDIVTDRIHGAPDLVIEVLSPRPRIGELDERVGWFARYGVREIWLATTSTSRSSMFWPPRTARSARV
ncbi:MAG: Uma2 family endonuclease [Acidobacteria bacterium]|nr:Uma2 family endonuclease [Acidobacteriota bacterium]